jgi:hypothetical protein
MTGVRAACLMSAACAAAALAGCGGHSAPATSSTSAAPPRPEAARSAPPQRAGGVELTLPRGVEPAPRPKHAASYPVPVRLAASFPIHRASANALCPPQAVLERMPRDGIYVVVAEYTRPRPRGIPAGVPIHGRDSLERIQVADEQVECWEGPGAYARFRDNGRSFYVEALFGRDVSIARQRATLDALKRVRVR